MHARGEAELVYQITRACKSNIPCTRGHSLTITYTKLRVPPSARTWRWGTEIPLPLPVWGRARQLLQPSRRRTLERNTAGGQTWPHREVGHQQWTLQWGRWCTDTSVKYSCWWEFGFVYQRVASYGRIEMSNLGSCIIIGFNLLADKNGKHEHQKTNYRQAQANVCDGAHSDCKIVRQWSWIQIL